MFWRFNLLTSHIDTILDKLDVTLHEVMDEGDVLQECKSQNRKLIEFLVRPENLEELVNMVTQEPSDDMEEKLKYKFPNTACELLTSDIHEITDKLAGDEALLNKIYAFLESDAPLNPLLASFFSKVMGLLITRKSQLMVDFLRSKEDFVGQLLHHLGTSAVMDLLLRLITCIDSADCRLVCVNWLNDQQLVLKLVQMIDPAYPDEKHCNAAQSLCDIIRLSRDQMSQHQEKADQDPLLTAVESQDTIAELLTHMLEGEKNESVIVNGLSVIQTLLEFKKMGVDFFRAEGSTDQLTVLDNERLALAVSKTVSAIVPRLKDLHQLLIEPPKQHYFVMPTTIGSLDPPLGNSRLQTVRLIATLLLNNTTSINEELHRLGTIQVLLDLYFKYSWNNFLHTQGELCIATILSTVPAEVDEGDKTDLTLIQQLLVDFKLIQQVLDAWEDNDQQQARPGGHRRGYMGHLTKIANHLADSIVKGNNSERIKKCIQEIPEETREKWETFISGNLAEMNKQNTVDLVRNHPLNSSSEDDDPGFHDIPFPEDSAMQQAFSDYQLQQMTSNFIDQFGFNEEEFVEQQEPTDARISSISFDINTAENSPNAASLFEQACNDRIHQFDDDNGSDEELWEEKEIFSYAQGDAGRPSPNVPGRRGGETGPAGETGGDSDGSTDSEEELDSPRRILQMPSTTENMDIDSSTATTGQPTNAWAQTSTPVCPVPIAMDTASPWDTQQPSSSTETDENWATFDNPASAANPSSTSTSENWANFSAFNSTEPAQGSTPVAMDTADSSVPPLADRAAAYLVSSAPADLCSEVSSVDTTTVGAASSEVTPSPAASDKPPTAEAMPTSSNGSPSAKTSDEPTTSNSAPAETTVHSESMNNADGVSSSTDSFSGSPPALPLASPPRSPPPSPPLDDLLEAEAEEDLSDNFNFLAGSGLMRASDTATPDKVENSEMSSPDSLEETDEQTKLEEVRAEAKAALEQFAAAAGGASNGPV